jgi:ribosome-associated protein
MIPTAMGKHFKKGYWVKGQFVAEGSEMDMLLKNADIPSKSDLKRESEDLQKLGEDLLTLRADLYAKLDLPENLHQAIEDAKRITAHEGKRRQMQYIGKLMRKVDAEPIRAALDAQRMGSASETLALHEAEAWRDQLIADDEAFQTWVQAHPSTDTQQLRALIRQARKDQQAAAKTPAGQTPRHGRAYREIFQLVRDALAAQDDARRSGDDSPKDTPPNLA